MRLIRVLGNLLVKRFMPAKVKLAADFCSEFYTGAN
jgi:hypothetical protein